jgi:hypothetical protein
MPASMVVYGDPTQSASPGLSTFKTAQATARSTLDAALAGLSPSDPASDAQSDFDAYQASVDTALTAIYSSHSSMHATADSMNVMLKDAYIDVQASIDGGATVGDLTDTLDEFGDSLDGMLDGGEFDSAFGYSSEDDITVPIIAIGNTPSVDEDGNQLLDDDGNPLGLSLQVNSAAFIKRLELSVDEPSQCIITVPFADEKEDTVPAVAGLNDVPGRDEFNAGTRVLVSIGSGDDAIPVYVGNSVKQADDLQPDGTTIVCLDDKWRMQGVHVVGSFHWEPTLQEIQYRERGPCEFNPNGRPNCIDTPFGPMFTTYPDYGNEVGTNPSTLESTTKARLWRMADCLSYLRFACYGQDVLDYTGSFPWYVTLSDEYVSWPESLGTAIAIDSVSTGDDEKSTVNGVKDFDREQGDKGKIISLSIEGFDLEAAFLRILSSAGAYGLYMRAGMDGRSIMSIIPTRFRTMFVTPNDTQVAVRYKGTAPVTNYPRLKRGTIIYDATNSYTSVVVNADVVLYETTISFDPSDMDDRGTWLDETMQPADTNLEVLGFRDYVANHPTYPGTTQAFQDAVSMFEKTFCGFQVNQDIDFQTGTLYDGFPRVNAPNPILNHLLSWQTEVGEGSMKRRLPMPVCVEIKVDDDGDGVPDTWHFVGRADGLEVDNQGVFYLTALRDAALQGQDKGTWVGQITDAQGTSDPDNKLNYRPIRMTVAMMLDHRLNKCVAFSTSELSIADQLTNPVGPVQPNDPTGMVVIADPNEDKGSFAQRLRRQMLIDVDQSYRQYMRKDSSVIPESVSTLSLDGVGDPIEYLLGARGTEDADGSDDSHPLLLDEADFAQIHAQRRFAAVGRIARSASLCFDDFVFWEPGTVIEVLETRDEDDEVIDTVRVDGIVTKLTFDVEEQESEMDLR